VGNLDEYIDYVNLHMYQLTFWPDNNGWSVNGSRNITWYLDYGLLRNDLSEKPSFRAVKNLITILCDKGPNFEPDKLNYVLECQC
jgi:hypothetical protein